ncbi:NifU family protein [Spiroplasma endosymbiont of Labia minor]|uniref:NifU family protein n=1 Tax=Spiroplasma endosymbiont of Labia minor TaxID=3066305 RepID=UPI0030D248AA
MALDLIPKKIKAFLDEMRIIIKMDGGDMEPLGIKEKIVYIRLLGNCINCGLIDISFKEGIEQALLEEFPDEINGIEVIM